VVGPARGSGMKEAERSVEGGLETAGRRMARPLGIARTDGEGTAARVPAAVQPFGSHKQLYRISQGIKQKKSYLYIWFIAVV
jgi:hypothetical protein